MPDFTYTGEDERVFITLSVDGHGVQVNPGDVITLDVDPGIETLVAVAPSKASKSAPAPTDPAPVPDVSGADVAASDATPTTPEA